MAEQQEKVTFLGFLNKHFLSIVILVVGILWYAKKNGAADGRLISSDTTRTTTQVLQPIVIGPQYTPQQSGTTVYPITIPQQYQPSQDNSKLLEQYTDLVNKFLAVKNYKDSIQLKDSAGNRVGVVNLDQTVSENTLQSAQPTYQLSFPHTTTTITNTVAAKIRNQVFFGASVQSPINVPIIGQVDLGLVFKNKKENIITLSGTYDLKSNQPGVRVGYYQKISFSK